jgi:hypothetical protein
MKRENRSAGGNPENHSVITIASNGGITKGERDSLLQVARLRARVAKDQVVAFAAKLKADFEKQLDAHYPWDSDETWSAMAKLVETTKQEAQAQVAARSRELGIPDWAAPSIGWSWRGQGQQATKERKTELRRLAATQIDAMIKAAKAKVDEASLAIQTELHASGLTSEAAKAFLESMPTPEALMPAVDIAALDTKLLRPSQHRYTLGEE